MHDIHADVIVTMPDRPKGRNLVMTPPPIKTWADKKGIQVLQFEKLNQDAVDALRKIKPSLFLVASYGNIIPQSVLDLPKHGTLNVHPSLLPSYRGATPLQSVVLDDQRHTGVTIIQMDAKMDHGPIVAAREITVEPWPLKTTELELRLAIESADILCDALGSYLDGSKVPTEQDHDKATFTKKISKEDGLIKIEKDDFNNEGAHEYGGDDSLDIGLSGERGWKAYLTYLALDGWPGTYFFIEKDGRQMRVKINEASWNDTEKRFELNKVTPEGKKEMTWKEFQNFLHN